MTTIPPLGVPAGAVRSRDEVFASPEVLERGRVSQIPASSGDGVIPNSASPFVFSATPVADPVAAPMLGQHTAEVLRGALGYAPERISQLVESGVVQGAN